MKRFAISVSIIALTATTSPALADTTDEAVDPDRDYLPSDIVVRGDRPDGYAIDDGSSATKTPTPIIDVPQAVSAITSDQLEDQNIRQLGEALRYVPGVSMESGEGQRDEVFIRGQETTADFYLDGLRDDAQYYRSLYNIDRVEVLKGANALIFGRGAGGGAINRVSKKASLIEDVTAAHASVDNFGSFAVTGDVSRPVADTIAIRFNAAYEEFDNNRNFYDGRFIGISPTVTAALGEHTTLIASYTYDDDRRVTDRGVPSLNGLPLMDYDETLFGDPDFNLSTVEAHIARARLDHEFSAGLSGNVALQYAHYDKYYGNIVPSGSADTNDDGVADRVSLGGYESSTVRENLIGQANLIWEGRTGAIGHTLLAGVEFARQDTDADRNRALFGGETSTTVDLAEVIAIPAYTLEAQRASTSQLETISLYIQDQVELTPWLQVVAGLRYDEFDLDSYNILDDFPAQRKDTAVSPRFGVILKPAPEISVYASYGESFLPASGNQFTVLSEGSVLLDPEEFENLELGVKYAPNPGLLLTAAIFRLERSNTPDVNEDGLTVLTGKSRVQGFELSAAGELLPNLNVNLGYTYLDGEILSDTSSADVGDELQQLPKHQLGLWSRYDFTERFGIGAGLIHQSSQFTSFSNNVVLPSYWRVDAAAYFDLSEAIGLQLNVENLFDEDYYASAHGDNNIQPGKPLTASVGVRIGF